MVKRNTRQNMNVRIEEKRHKKYLDEKREYNLNQSWSKWKLLIIIVKQINFIGK
jgi:hypothetical protein